MNSLKRIVGTSILSLARFLDAYFYYIVAVFAGLAAFNYFFVKNYDKELFEAAKVGNIKRLKEALRNDADVNSMHMGECTALMMACGMKHEEVARVLVETEKCKIDTVDAKGRSALLIASGAGLVDSVKLLLKNKADVKLSDNNGSTPLIVACLGGHAEIVKNLLAFGAEPRWKNKQGLNALAAAINAHNEEGGRLPVIKELLSYCFKKDLNIVDSRNITTGWTPLIRACYKGYADVAKLLLDYNADIEAKGKKGFTALIAASQNGWKDAVKLLLDRGANPLAALEDGSTAIVAASFGGYHEVVEMLVKCDPACLAVRFKGGSTPLMTAALNGFLSVVQVLLAHGADVNALNDDNWGALAVAAQKGCLKICALLLEAGAAIDVATDRGYTPLMLAVKSGHLDVAKLLVQHGAQVNHFNVHDLTDKLTAQRIPLLYGYLSPLMLTINRADEELISFLLEAGADVTLDLARLMVHCTDPKDKYTAEQYEIVKRTAREAEEKEVSLKAAMEKSEMAQRLAAATAYRDAQVESESAFKKLEVFQEEQQQQHEALKDATLIYSHFATPLLFAVYWKSVPMVQLLLQAAEKGKEGNNEDMVRKVLSQTNTNGLTALDLALEFGCADIALVLMERGAKFAVPTRVVRFVGKMLYRWRGWGMVKVLGYAAYTALVRSPPRSSAHSETAKRKED